MNYFDLLEKQAKLLGDKLFLQVDDTAYSYAQFYREVLAISREIALRGQAVLIDAADFGEQLQLFLAAQAAGNVPIILHRDLPDAASEELRQKNHIMYLLTKDCEPRQAESVHPVGRFRLAAFRGEPLALPAEPAACMGVLSSGSTAAPKVMLRSYESWAGFFPVQNEIFRVGKATRLFLQGSLSFTGNLNVVLAVLCAGGTVVTSRLCRCRTWLDLLRQFSVDVLYLVPTKLKLLVKFAQAPLPALRLLFTGSQLLGAATARRLKDMFPYSEILLYYGTSELNYITYMKYESLQENPLCVGRPFPGVKLSFLHGYVYVDTRYHIYGAKMPFTVKDAGYLNEAGQLIFLGRQQAIVNRGGFKVSCVKVEIAIRQVPGVEDAVVLSYDDEQRGSELAAFVVGEELAKRDICCRLRGILLPAEVPRRFVFVAAIPLNDRGKVDAAKLMVLLGGQSVFP